MAQGMTGIYLDNGFEHIWLIAALRHVCEQLHRDRHSLSFLMVEWGCIERHMLVTYLPVSACGTMEDKNSLHNLNIGSKSRTGVGK